MEVSINGIKVFYERQNGSGTPIVILHGWGASSEAVMPIYKPLVARGRDVTALDFPLFGKSDKPPTNFDFFDYVNLTRNFLKSQNISKAIIIGHSFGGRVGIALAAQNAETVEKLVLIDAAGIKPKFSIKKSVKQINYKLRKKLKLKLPQSVGSKDYQSLPDDYKGIFVRIVNTHLNHLIKSIKAPTLLIWGKDDSDTPLYMAKKLEKSISDSGLIVLENAGHFSYIDKRFEVSEILKAFI